MKDWLRRWLCPCPLPWRKPDSDSGYKWMECMFCGKAHEIRERRYYS